MTNSDKTNYFHYKKMHIFTTNRIIKHSYQEAKQIVEASGGIYEEGSHILPTINESLRQTVDKYVPILGKKLWELLKNKVTRLSVSNPTIKPKVIIFDLDETLIYNNEPNKYRGFFDHIGNMRNFHTDTLTELGAYIVKYGAELSKRAIIAVHTARMFDPENVTDLDWLEQMAISQYTDYLLLRPTQERFLSSGLLKKLQLIEVKKACEGNICFHAFLDDFEECRAEYRDTCKYTPIITKDTKIEEIKYIFDEILLLKPII